MAARDGPQTGAAQWASVNKTPLPAKASRCGVLTWGWPSRQPIQSFKSSIAMNRILGRPRATAAVSPTTTKANKIPNPPSRENMTRETPDRTSTKRKDDFSRIPVPFTTSTSANVNWPSRFKRTRTFSRLISRARTLAPSKSIGSSCISRANDRPRDSDSDPDPASTIVAQLCSFPSTAIATSS